MDAPFPHKRKTCIACGQDTLTPVIWIRKEGEPPGSPGHNILYLANSVAACQSCGQAQMEEYNHDCFSPPGEEDWDMYWWYLFDQKELVFLRSLLAECPAPLDPACTCALHHDFRKSCESLFTRFRYRGRLKHSVFPGLDTDFLRISIEKEGEHYILLPAV